MFRLLQILQRFVECVALLGGFHQVKQRLNIRGPRLSPLLGNIVGHLPGTVLTGPVQPCLEGFRMRVGLAGAFIQRPRRRHSTLLLVPLAGTPVRSHLLLQILDDFRRDSLD